MNLLLNIRVDFNDFFRRILNDITHTLISSIQQIIGRFFNTCRNKRVLTRFKIDLELLFGERVLSLLLNFNFFGDDRGFIITVEVDSDDTCRI